MSFVATTKGTYQLAAGGPEFQSGVSLGKSPQALDCQDLTDFGVYHFVDQEKHDIHWPYEESAKVGIFVGILNFCFLTSNSW